MTFWQENYAFIKDVYDMRHQKMAEWMENVEKVRQYVQIYFICTVKFLTADQKILGTKMLGSFSGKVKFCQMKKEIRCSCWRLEFPKDNQRDRGKIPFDNSFDKSF